MAGLPHLLLIVFGVVLGKFEVFYSNFEMFTDLCECAVEEESEQHETGDGL